MRAVPRAGAFYGALGRVALLAGLLADEAERKQIGSAAEERAEQLDLVRAGLRRAGGQWQGDPRRRRGRRRLLRSAPTSAQLGSESLQPRSRLRSRALGLREAMLLVREILEDGAVVAGHDSMDARVQRRFWTLTRGAMVSHRAPTATGLRGRRAPGRASAGSRLANSRLLRAFAA